MIRILSAALVVAVIVALFLGWRSTAAVSRADRAELALSEAKGAVGYLQRTLKTEQDKAKSLASIGDKLEEDRTDAETVPAAVVADLRNGNLRLRKQWAACEASRVPDSPAAAVQRDAEAELRREDQGDLVRVGRDADDALKACQAVVVADRANP